MDGKFSYTLSLYKLTNICVSVVGSVLIRVCHLVFLFYLIVTYCCFCCKIVTYCYILLNIVIYCYIFCYILSHIVTYCYIYSYKTKTFVSFLIWFCTYSSIRLNSFSNTLVNPSNQTRLFMISNIGN